MLGFLASPCSGAIWERLAAPGSPQLFDAHLEAFGEFRQVLRPDQVARTLSSLFPESFWTHPLGPIWAQDVEALCQAFCREIRQDCCQLHLDCERPCQRFHADNLLIRLVCTYRGPGTQWLLEDNLNLEAARSKGTHNHDIVRRPEDIQQLREWEVLVMKGKQTTTGQPLYHKSPPPAAEQPKSLILKLDCPA